MKKKFEAKGVLLRHYSTMGTNVTEPFEPIIMDSKQAVLDHVKTLMVDNIIGCGITLIVHTKTENEDEMYWSKKNEFICLGKTDLIQCGKLEEISKQIK